MRPLDTPLNLKARFRKRMTVAIVVGLLLLITLLPTIVTQLLRYQIPRMGMGQVEIGNIDINLFRGRVVVEGLGLYQSTAERLYLERAELDIAILSLLEQRFHIQSLTLHGLSVAVEQQGDDMPLKIAGQSIPGPAEKEGTPDTGEPSAWQFGIDALDISDSAIHIIHPQFTETVELNRISLGALAMWRQEHLTPVSVLLGLREATTSINVKTSPFSTAAAHKIDIDINALPLSVFSSLAAPALTGLDGALSTQMQLQIRQAGADKISLQQRGSITLTGLHLQQGESSLSQEALSWQGAVELGDSSNLNSLMVSGELALKGIKLSEVGKKEAGISVEGLSLTGVKLEGINALRMDEFTIDSLNAWVTRTSSGIVLAGIPEAAEKPTDTSEIEPEEGEGAETGEEPPFKFSLNSLQMKGNNRITFSDQTVKPPFEQAITITSAEIHPIDTTQTEQPSQLQITGQDDQHTRFSIEGEVKPFLQPLALNLKVKLTHFDMPPTSPYLAQLLGYRITTGLLDSNVALAIDNNLMNGELELHMNKLKLEPEDPERIKEYQSRTALPLDTALSLLRDKNDNIELNIPISGKMDDPQFDINDIINSALAKSLKVASVSYLKHLLQPYGSLITIVQLVGKAAGKVSLDPIQFSPGSAELSADAQTYLNRIYTLLEKKEIKLTLCGFATQADLTTLSKGKEKTIPPAGHPLLESLARERAVTIKSALVNQLGASPKQLLICHPEIDRAETAQARVEISI